MDWGLGMQDSGSGIRDYGLEIRDQGSGIRDQGSGMLIEYHDKYKKKMVGQVNFHELRDKGLWIGNGE